MASEIKHDSVSPDLLHRSWPRQLAVCLVHVIGENLALFTCRPAPSVLISSCISSSSRWTDMECKSETHGSTPLQAGVKRFLQTRIDQIIRPQLIVESCFRSLLRPVSGTASASQYGVLLQVPQTSTSSCPWLASSRLGSHMLDVQSRLNISFWDGETIQLLRLARPAQFELILHAAVREDPTTSVSLRGITSTCTPGTFV